ncbi:MAG: N-acetylmuramoyl-L-alanine amidase [Acidimicrobiales bacterium]
MTILVVVTSCGVGGDGVELGDPVPTIFPVDEPTPGAAEASSTTSSATSTTSVPVSELLPRLRDDGEARVVITPTGVVVGVIGTTDRGWSVRTPCGVEVELTEGTPLSAAHVVLDPGHGGSETGAVGPNDIRESDLNLTVARLVADELESMGVAVVLTRTTDVRITLASRALVATALDAPAFVSIHHNADPAGRSDWPGSEAWYQIADGESRRLAGLVYEEVLAALEVFDVDWVSDTDAGAKYRLNQRGTDYYGILRNAAGVPSVLAELAFISNPAEAELLATGEMRSAEAGAVARGILRFLTSADPGSGFVEPYERVEPAGPGGGAEGCEDPPLQ